MIFLTVATGIAHLRDLGKLGKVVAKWEKGLDREALDRAPAGGSSPVSVGGREADDD